MDLSPAWWIASLSVGSLGVGFFVYGRKQARLPQFLAGIALVAESSLVPSVAWMLALAGLILAALWGALRSGA